MKNRDIDKECLIDDYVIGRLDETLRADFESEMKEDLELYNDVILTQTIRDSLVRREKNRIKIREMEAELRRIKRKTMFWKRIVPIAACAALIVSLTYPCSYYGLQDKDHWNSAIRGELIDDIAQCVADGNYDSALILIDEDIAERRALMPTAEDSSYIVAEVKFLEWTRIQTLLKMREFTSAYAEVEKFRRDAGYYQKEADRLFIRLKVRLCLIK